MSTNLWKWLRGLGTFVGIAYLVLGVAIGLWPDYWDEASAGDQVLFLVVVVGGGILLLAGLRLFERSAWGAAALVSFGALIGSVAFYWSIAVPLIALALVVLSVVHARRLAAVS